MIIVMHNSKTGYSVAGSVVRDEPESFIVSIPGSGRYWCRIRKDACNYVWHSDHFIKERRGDTLLLAVDGWTDLSEDERKQLWEDERANFKKVAKLVKREQLEDGRWQEIYTIPLMSELTDTHS